MTNSIGFDASDYDRYKHFERSEKRKAPWTVGFFCANFVAMGLVAADYDYLIFDISSGSVWLCVFLITLWLVYSGQEDKYQALVYASRIAHRAAEDREMKLAELLEAAEDKMDLMEIDLEFCMSEDELAEARKSWEPDDEGS